MTRSTGSTSKRSEKQIQAEIVKNLRSLGWFVTTFSQAQKAQMTAGVPDVFAAHRKHGQIWIEVKKPERRNEKRGGLSLAQVLWHAEAKDSGLSLLVAYGWAEVQAELQRLGVPIT